MVVDYQKALEVATAAHDGYTDKVGVAYIQHPLAVAAAVEGTQEKIVALLHDVVEDTEVTLDDLRGHGFDEIIIAAVDAITKRKGEPLEDYLARVKANPVALAVKFADIQHNMLPERHQKLSSETKKRLHVKYDHALRFLRGGLIND